MHLFIIVFLISSSADNAVTYYVKNGGDGNVDGISDATTWTTLNKINLV